MDREEILRMAREAWQLEFIQKSDVSKLERFAELVAAAEREACATLVEKNADMCGTNTMLCDVLRGNAEAIRARGES